MALTVTVNKYASSNVQAVHRRSNSDVARKKPATKWSKSTTAAAEKITDLGRRGLLLSTVVAAPPLMNDSSNELLKKYLKKSEENKAKNDKERKDSYYKRNYRDYFEYLEGSLRGKTEEQLSESEKAILEWLKTNK